MALNIGKFVFENREFPRRLCDIFEENVSKSYIPEGINPEKNFKFMPYHFPPFTTHFNQNGSTQHVTCGGLFRLIAEVAIKLKAK